MQSFVQTVIQIITSRPEIAATTSAQPLFRESCYTWSCKPQITYACRYRYMHMSIKAQCNCANKLIVYLSITGYWLASYSCDMSFNIFLDRTISGIELGAYCFVGAFASVNCISCTPALLLECKFIYISRSAHVFHSSALLGHHISLCSVSLWCVSVSRASLASMALNLNWWCLSWACRRWLMVDSDHCM